MTRAYRKPHERPEGKIEWRTTLPLSLPCDHRVINGADTARFCLTFAEGLSSPDQL
jgi:pyruvate/2-oxoglutarate dehydrogenase complex dihydrolipoamide acyltransferase (E2) component